MRTAQIYNFLLEANLTASAAILLMLVVRRFFRKALGNRVVYFAWLLIALRLLCPLSLPNPAVNGLRSAFAQDLAVRPIPGQLKVRFSDTLENLEDALERRPSLPGGKSLAKTLRQARDEMDNGVFSLRLMKLYLLGAGATAFWFLLANLRFRRRLRADRIEPVSGRLLEQYEFLCKQRGARPIPVYFTDPLPSACLVGAFRPYIALPLSARPQEAVQVLAHEVCHYQGRDHLWALLRLACCALHWFNPLVWLAANLSRVDGELACDDRVVRKLKPEQRLEYANVLVLAASRRNLPGVGVLATGMTMTGRRLKTRVHAVLHGGDARRGLALVFVLAACMALVGAFATDEYVYPLRAPGQQASLTARPVATAEEAVSYARDFWAREDVAWPENDLLWQSSAGELLWHADDRGQEWIVYGENPERGRMLRLQFQKETGYVTGLKNDFAAYGAVWGAQISYSQDEQEEVARALLAFAEAAHPGASQQIEGLRLLDETTSDGARRFLNFVGYCNGEASFCFQVQTSPCWTITQYEEPFACRYPGETEPEAGENG